MFRFLLGEDIAQSAQGAVFSKRLGERKSRVSGTVFISGTFGGATAKITVGLSGTSKTFTLASLTSAGFVNINGDYDSIRATVTGGNGSTSLTFECVSTVEFVEEVLGTKSFAGRYEVFGPSRTSFTGDAVQVVASPEGRRTGRIVGTAYLYSTNFGDATLNIQYRQRAGQGDWVTVPGGSVTADTLLNLDADIEEFRALVTDGVTDEKQSIILTGQEGGVFRLAYGGQETADIAYNASAATVVAALEALSTIGAGNVTATGGALPGTAVVLTFTGPLGGTNIDEITFVPQGRVVRKTLGVGGETPANEEQYITICGCDGGHFKILFEDEASADIAYNASAATVQAALEALSTIGAGRVSVTGNALPHGKLTVEFVGDAAATPMDLLEIDTTDLQASAAMVTTTVQGVPTDARVVIASDYLLG